MFYNKQLVILDLGGVLVSEAEANLHKAKNLELQKILSGNAPKIKIFNRAFEFASLFCGAQCKNDWILGRTSGAKIVSKIKENIDNIEHANFFTNQYEKDLIKYGIEFVLLPNLLIELTEIILEGFDFIKKCKNNNIELGIISNWDPESFLILKKKLVKLFNLFDEKNIIIPQMVGSTKPDFKIYEFAIQNTKIDIENCFFIDDGLTNVKAAQNYGIKSVMHKSWIDTEKELINLGLKFKNS